MMGLLGAFFRGLGNPLAGGAGLGSMSRWNGVAVLYGFFFAVFCVIGFVLVMLGFDLDAVDRWLDARAGWFDAIGTLLFKAVLVVILLFCAGMIGVGIHQRVTRAPKDERWVGWGGMIVSALFGWLCWVGIVNRI